MKKIAFLLAIVIILTLFSGCDLLKKPIIEDPAEPPNPVIKGERPALDIKSKGGYVEKELYTNDVPYAIMSINRLGDNGVRVFSYPYDHEYTASGEIPEFFVSRSFEQGEDCITEEVSWYDIVPGAYGDQYVPLSITSSKDGAIYTYAVDFSEGSSDTTLFWKMVYMGEITEFAYNVEDNPSYWQVVGIYPVSDSRMASLYTDYVLDSSANCKALMLIFDTDSGEVIYSDELLFPYTTLISDRNPGVLTANDTSLFYIDGEEILEVSVEDGREISKTRIPDTDIIHLITPTEDTIFYLDKTGINSLPVGGDSPTLILEASRHSFGSPDWMTREAIRGSEGDFYLLLTSRSGRGSRVVKYSYDKNLTLLPQKKMTLTDLTDSVIIKLAVDLFRNEHPEIALEYTQPYDFVTEEYKSEADRKTRFDYYNQLKADILSGNFSDVVVAPAGVFKDGISKGLFLNLRGNLPTAAENVLASEKGSFGAPLSIRLPIIYGKHGDLDKINDIGSLISFCEANFPAVEYTPPETLFDTVYTYYADRIDDGLPDEELLKEFMTDVERLITAVTSPENAYYDPYNHDKIGSHFMSTGTFGPGKTYYTGETETIFPIALSFNGNIPDFLYSVHGFKSDEDMMFDIPFPLEDYSLKLLVSDTIMPVDAAAVNAKTEVPDEAVAFVEFLYSDYLEENYTYEYFPLSAVEANEKKAYFENLIFNKENFNLKDDFKPYEFDFAALYDNLETPLIIDYERLDILLRNTMDYVFGGVALDQAAGNAAGELKNLG